MDSLKRSRDGRLIGAAAFLALLFLAAVPGASPAQDPAAGGQAGREAQELFDDLKADERAGTGQMRRWLLGARRDIERGSHIQAVAELQKILDSEEDRTAQLSDAPDAPHQSLKLQALLMLSQHVNTGRNEYETQFGGVAQDLLDKARQAASTEALELVVRRFFHTQAGYEAVYRLACSELDAGLWLDAALDFDRLRQCPWAAKRFEPELSLRTALAWHWAGYPAPASQALGELKSFGVQQVHVGGRVSPIFPRDDAALDWLGDLFGPPPPARGPHDWLMVRGDVRRTAVSSGGSPYLNQGWRRDTIEKSCEKPEQDDQLRRILANSIRRPEGSRQSLIPAVQPVVVGDVVFYRTLGGMRSLNATTGEQVDLVLDRDPILKRLLDASANAGNRPQQLPLLPNFVLSRMWRDQTYGTLSSDGTHLFAVEPAIPASEITSMRRGHFLFANDNRLVSYDLDCRLIWEIGAPASEVRDPYAGAYFLGPPLTVGNRLYAMVDYSGDLRLVCLRPGDARFEWSQSLWQAPPLTYGVVEPPRRACGLSPSFAGGIFVCPTESGAVVGFDRTTRTLLWKFQYEVTPEKSPNLQAARRNRWMQVQQEAGNDPDTWVDALATIVDDRVLVTPRDLDELVCLNLRTGEVHWRVDRGDGLFLAGVHNDRIIVVSRLGSVTALRISDGQHAWPAVEIAEPSGRGFLTGDQLFLPVAKAIVTIDLVGGKKAAETLAREGRQLGNLVAAPGSIISQGIDFIDGYEQFQRMEANIAAALEKNPNDATALTLRAEIRLQRGDKDGAYADFQKALSLKPDDQRARTVLTEMLLDGLRIDFPKYRQRSADLDSLIADVKTRSQYAILMSEGLGAACERLEAFKVLLPLTDPQFDERPPSSATVQP